MTVDENKATVRRFIEALGGHRDLGAFRELVKPGSELARPEKAKVREQAQAFFRMMLASMPDLKVTIEDQLAEGDKVVTRWVVQGTQKGEWVSHLGRVPETGHPVRFEGIHIARIENGTIVENWVQWDRLGALQHVGAQPQLHR